MIELTDEQLEALEKLDATPLRVVKPRTNETFVLLPIAEYEHLKDTEYDDSPWTREEIEALAAEAAELTEWDEYGDAAEKR
jgi:PHD/YefM family antitoxin component YafN of YafNO toxin-antitoxin module